MNNAERKEIHDYLKRAAKLSPKKRLKYMDEMRKFFYDNMTPEGRKFFERTKREVEQL